VGFRRESEPIKTVALVLERLKNDSHSNPNPHTIRVSAQINSALLGTQCQDDMNHDLRFYENDSPDLRHGEEQTTGELSFHFRTFSYYTPRVEGCHCDEPPNYGPPYERVSQLFSFAYVFFYTSKHCRKIALEKGMYRYRFCWSSRAPVVEVQDCQDLSYMGGFLYLKLDGSFSWGGYIVSWAT